jgi:hypothetical protein
MKKSIVTKVLFLFWGIINAQCVTNGAMTSSCGGDGYNQPTLCVQGWQNTHGTPSVFGTVGGNTWAWMWSYSTSLNGITTNKGEGIVTNYNFVAGKTYQVSFRIRTSTNVASPSQAVLNSVANVRAVSGMVSNGSSIVPSLPANNELIWSRIIGTNINNWQTISVSFTPTNNNSQLWFYPLMTAISASNSSAQAQMEIDDVVIIPPVTSVFNFQGSNGVAKTSFDCGESVYLNGLASFGEDNYYLDVWKRPAGSSALFQWDAKLGSTGWTAGQLGILNLTSLFALQNYVFASGFEYQIKVATASSPCVGWVETSHAFTVTNQNSNASPAFTFVTTCGANGTISVTATATDTTLGLGHWWELIETSVQGSTTNDIIQVGATLNGNTVTFNGLLNSKNYYIKHRISNSCNPWRESRVAIPKNISWVGYTTNFNFTSITSNGNGVSVTVQAASNPVFVNDQWSIHFAPNGDTTGNISVPGNPIQCCASIATFNVNLVVNEWYYVKHGIFNECNTWNETRRAFRVVIQGLLNGNPIYAIEETEIFSGQLTPKGLKMSQVLSNEVVFSPNPVKKGSNCKVTTDVEHVRDIFIIDFMGKTDKILFTKIDDNTIEFNINEELKKGVYAINIYNKDFTFTSKKIIIE